MDLVEFLRTRLDEDEQDANTPPNGHMSHAADEVGTVNRDCPDCRTPYARNRMLTEVDAKRRIIKLAEQSIADADRKVPEQIERSFNAGAAYVGHNTMLLLALPYADHHDYQADWRI